MPRGDYLRKGKGTTVTKVCTACDWEGVVSFFAQKCPECGHLNLKRKKGNKKISL